MIQFQVFIHTTIRLEIQLFLMHTQLIPWSQR